MRVAIRIKPNSKAEKIEQTGPNEFKVSVHEPPMENRANEAARKIIAAHFNVASSQVALVKGATSKNKVFEIVI